jgi:putative ABC transport system permease protein
MAGLEDPDAALARAMEADAGQPQGPMPWSMVARLAYRNLFHDRLSLTVTLVGILFSVVLVAVQLGLYIGSERMIAAMLDQSEADLWVIPLGTKSFDDPVFLSGRERHMALSTPGVARAEDLVVGFGAWRKPKGGTTAVLVVGSSLQPGSTLPWNIVEGSVAGLRAPAGVAVDRTYFEDLGITANGAQAEINGNAVTVTTLTHGIRSFTTLPYVFTTLPRARAFLDAGRDQASYTLIKIAEGTDIETVRKALSARMPDNEILTQQEFRKRSLDYWLFQTGAGSALIAGAILGIIVGIVIVAQTLYASTKDHLNEFATLRALGASGGYIHRVILMQALLSALIGYLLGMVLSLIIIWATRDTTLVVVMTPWLAGFLFALTIAMCTLAAISAILKVTRIDPATVFSR